MPQPESRAGNNLALKAFAPAAELYVLKPWISMLALLADWGLIALSFACAALWPHPATYLFAALLIARSQLALAVIMHESAHGVLLPRQKPNDVIGQLAAAGPLFISMQTYRAGHLKHHLHPMQYDDPVVAVFGLGITHNQEASWPLDYWLICVEWDISSAHSDLPGGLSRNHAQGR